MHWTNIGLILIAGFDLGVALLVWLRNPKNRINIYFALNQAGLGLWSLSLSLFREATDIYYITILSFIWPLVASSTIIFFFLFTVFFPYKIYNLKPFQKILVLFSPVILIILTIIPRFWHEDIVIIEHQNVIIENWRGQTIFVIFFLLYVFFGLLTLYKKYKKSDGETHLFIRYIFIGFIIVLSFSCVLGVLATLFFGTTGLVWIVPFSILPLNFIILYLLIFRIG